METWLAETITRHPAERSRVANGFFDLADTLEPIDPTTARILFEIGMFILEGSARLREKTHT